MTDDNAFVQAPAETEVETHKWTPEVPGDTLIGVLRRQASVDTKFGPGDVIDIKKVEVFTANGVTIPIPTGEEASWWPNSNGLRALENAGVAVGERFGVRLLELKDTGKGNPLKVFGIATADKLPAPTEPTFTPVDDEEPF